MATKDIALKLLALDKSKRASIVTKATLAYMQILYHISVDIYDSCIAEFYNGYVPISYTRHGYIEGRNLYLANQTFMQNGYLGVEISASELMPYGKKTSKAKVFNSVTNGLRGGPDIQIVVPCIEMYGVAVEQQFKVFTKIFFRMLLQIQQIYFGTVLIN